MHLVHLQADGFRNLREVKLDAHRRLNAFLGPNGQGKTNLLESIHLAAALRPLRPTEKARDLLGFDRESGQIRADFDLEGPLDVEVSIQPKGRKALMAGKAVRDIAEVASRLGVVAFTPEDLTIVRGSPDKRRRALDRFAFGLQPSFAHTARRYEQILDRRNRLLKSSHVDIQLWRSYSEPFVAAAVDLMVARARAASIWAPSFCDAARMITDSSVDTSLRYQSSLLKDDDVLAIDVEGLRQRFSDVMASKFEAERQRRTSLVGPHLDDVVFNLGDRRARHLASQGEARAIVLALKIASVRLFREARDAGPLLLLDDVAGELDPHKAKCLFRCVDEVGSQVFVTATHRELIPDQGSLRCFHLEEGRVIREEGEDAG